MTIKPQAIHRIFYLFSLLLLLSACAAAARILYPVETDPLKTKPGVYKLDPAHANIIFSVSHLGFSIHYGRFNKISGSLEIDPKAPETARTFISIDTGSVDTNSAELDEKLRARSMFNSEAHPIATFESTSLHITGEKSATINGFLNIKGNRKPVTLNATFIGSGTNPLTGLQTIGFSGEAKILRSDFGMNDWLPLVGDEVTLLLEAEFTRPG